MSVTPPPRPTTKVSSRHLLSAIEARGTIGVFIWDTRDDTVDWTPGMYALMRADPSGSPLSPKQIRAMVREEDALQYVNALRQGATLTGSTTRMTLSDDIEIFVECDFERMDCGPGHQAIILGVVRDVTKQKRLEQEFSRIQFFLRHLSRLHDVIS